MTEQHKTDLANGKTFISIIKEQQPATYPMIEEMVKIAGWKRAFENLKTVLLKSAKQDATDFLYLAECGFKYEQYSKLGNRNKAKKLFVNKNILVIGEHEHAGEEAKSTDLIYSEELCTYQLQVKNKKGETYLINNENVFVIVKSVMQRPDRN